MQVDDPLAEIAADLVRRGWWKEQDCLTFLAAAFEARITVSDRAAIGSLVTGATIRRAHLPPMIRAAFDMNGIGLSRKN
jgi:hypothetical protein